MDSLEEVALLEAGAGSRLRYLRRGSGPALVFLHGLLGASRQWQRSSEILASSFTCWMLELPGIGASTPIADASLSGLRTWLEQALRALGLASFSLIGSSWGGAVALEFASASPPRPQLQRLVLAAPTNPFWRPNRRQRWLLTPPLTRAIASLAPLLPPAALRRVAGAWLEPMYGDPARIPAAALPSQCAVLRRPSLAAAVAAYGRHWRRDQAGLAPHLSAVAAPALLIWGSLDRAVPVASAPQLRVALPQAQLHILPGLGHLPYEEDPETFCRLVQPFLAASRI